MYTKENILLVEMEEVEHSTESGIILDQQGDKFVSYGKLVQDCCVRNNEHDVPFTLTAGTRIIYSKDKISPYTEKLGFVEFHNVFGWEE